MKETIELIVTLLSTAVGLAGLNWIGVGVLAAVIGLGVWGMVSLKKAARRANEIRNDSKRAEEQKKLQKKADQIDDAAKSAEDEINEIRKKSGSN